MGWRVSVIIRGPVLTKIAERCVAPTHFSLLLFSGRTPQTVEPTAMLCVLPLMMAGRSGDWNSHPHSVTSVSPPTGATLGKNCRRGRGGGGGVDMEVREAVWEPWGGGGGGGRRTSVMTGSHELLLHCDSEHWCCREQTPEHQPQSMKRGAIRHMEHVLKWAQPGPREGTLNIWSTRQHERNVSICRSFFFFFFFFGKGPGVGIHSLLFLLPITGGEPGRKSCWRYLVPHHKEERLLRVDGRRPGHLAASQGVVGENDGPVEGEDHLKGRGGREKGGVRKPEGRRGFCPEDQVGLLLFIHIFRTNAPDDRPGRRRPHLQDASVRGAEVAQRVVPGGGDQDGGEEDVPHFPVEEVQPVVGLSHQGGLGAARVLVLGALRTKKKTKQKKCKGNKPVGPGG